MVIILKFAYHEIIAGSCRQKGSVLMGNSEAKGMELIISYY